MKASEFRDRTQPLQYLMWRKVFPLKICYLLLKKNLFSQNDQKGIFRGRTLILMINITYLNQYAPVPGSFFRIAEDQNSI